jgi:hypothetical protein
LFIRKALAPNDVIDEVKYLGRTFAVVPIAVCDFCKRPDRQRFRQRFLRHARPTGRRPADR